MLKSAEQRMRAGMALVDLHLHTTVSDGTWSPDELYCFLRASQITAFSITDHDAMEAYPVPADLVERAIPGMEVDTKHLGATVHLLVYGIVDMEAPLLRRLKAQRVARFERMLMMVERLRLAGKGISMDDVSQRAGSSASLGRPHLARALVRNGVVSSINEAFERHLGENGDAYVAIPSLESSEAIALAHASGAVACIAHPMRLHDRRILDSLREQGVDGIEIVHPTAAAGDRRELTSYAERYGLVLTGGSDFHTPEDGNLPGVSFSLDQLEGLKRRLASDMLEVTSLGPLA